MTIEEAIKIAEAATGGEGSDFPTEEFCKWIDWVEPEHTLALLKFVQAFDTWQESTEPAKVGQPFYNRLRKYRAAVDEALK